MAVGPVTDEIVLPTLVRIRDCLRVWFAAADSPLTNVNLRYGNSYAAQVSPMEDEACPGIVWVRWTGTADGSRNFPAASGQVSPCGPGLWGVGVEIGVVRCAAQWPPDGRLPSAAQWDAITTLALTDAATVRQAVACCAGDAYASWVAWGQAAPLAVDGNATGSTLQLTFPVPSGNNCSGEC